MHYLSTHYDPFQNPNDEDSFSEYGFCGTYISNGNSSGDKDDVSCKKCIKKFTQADEELKQAREHELNDMQGFVDFMKESK